MSCQTYLNLYDKLCSDLLSRHQYKCHAGHPALPKKGQRQNRKAQMNNNHDRFQNEKVNSKFVQPQLSQQNVEPSLDLSSISGIQDFDRIAQSIGTLYPQPTTVNNSQESSTLVQPHLFDLNPSSYTTDEINVNFSSNIVQSAAAWSQFFSQQQSQDSTNEAFKQAYDQQLGHNNNETQPTYLNSQPNNLPSTPSALPSTPLEFKLPYSPQINNSKPQPKSPFYSYDVHQLLNQFAVNDESETHLISSNGSNDNHNMQEIFSQFLSVPMTANNNNNNNNNNSNNDSSNNTDNDDSSQEENTQKSFADAAANKAINDVSALCLSQPPLYKLSKNHLSEQYRFPMLSGPPVASKAAGEDLTEYEKAVLGRQLPVLTLNPRVLRFQRKNNVKNEFQRRDVNNINDQSKINMKRELSTPNAPDESKRHAFSLPTPLSPVDATDVKPKLNEQIAIPKA